MAAVSTGRETTIDKGRKRGRDEGKNINGGIQERVAQAVTDEEERFRARGKENGGEGLAYTLMMGEADMSEAEATGLMREYMRFLGCIAVHGESEVTPSAGVDRCWRVHSKSRSYGRVCNAIAGRVIARPNTNTTATEVSKVQKVYEFTLSSYKKLFGAEAPKRYWPPRLALAAAPAVEEEEAENCADKIIEFLSDENISSSSSDEDDDYSD